MRKIISSIAGAALAAVSFGCFTDQEASTAHIPCVDGVDPAKYAGEWFEIARLPHRFERGMTDVKANYELRTDGRINVINSGEKDGARKEIRGIARFAGGYPPGQGELEVSFFRPFYGKYRIIHLEKDYSAAIVTSGTKDYFWILARTASLPREQLDRYLNMAAAWGFNTAALEYPWEHAAPAEGSASARKAP